MYNVSALKMFSETLKDELKIFILVIISSLFNLALITKEAVTDPVITKLPDKLK